MKPVAVLTLGLLLLNGMKMAFGNDVAPPPVFQEGDTWRIQIDRNNQMVSSTATLEGVVEIKIVQGQARIFQIEGNQKTEIPIQSDGSAQTTLRWIGKSEQRQDLKFPLSVGQNWSYEYKTRPVGARQDQSRAVEVNVVGIEEVTVPAGTFRAYKLVKADRGNRANSGTSTSIYYYSPETRSIVKSRTEAGAGTGTTESHLVKFSPAN